MTIWLRWVVAVLVWRVVDRQPGALVDAGVAGLTRFLRTRKQVGEGASWWPAHPGPSASARHKGKGKDHPAPDKGGKRNSKAWVAGAGSNNHTAQGGGNTTTATATAKPPPAHPHPTPYVCDHVCVDMNQILHGSVRTSEDPQHCVAKIFVGLDVIFRLVEPRKSLVLTFDGPAPFAKLQVRLTLSPHVVHTFFSPCARP